MLQIAELSQIHAPMIFWRCVKRLGDFKPTEGGEYVVRKTASGPVMIYRAAGGKLKSTGDTLYRWGIVGGDADVDLIRVPARSRKS